MNLAQPLSAATFVSAAVRVVLPWSICPIVPTFTCGLLRSNFSLAMSAPRSSCVLREAVAFPLSHIWSRCPESNWRPRPYQGRALPTELHRPLHLVICSSRHLVSSGRESMTRSPDDQIRPFVMERETG